MRGERATRDMRHNKDQDNLKSSLKRPNLKSKKHRVVFDESANEFFEADYIIVVRDECGYSDEGEGDECAGCGACERFPETEPGALSPPEGYKDLGLFNRDGTLREQAWWEAGDVLLVGERSGTVFTPQHLQLLRRLQRERMLRSTICADCDAHAALHQPLDIEYNYDEEETSDGEKELRPLTRRPAGKHIAAGEERPRTNSSQQTTPVEDCPPEMCIEDTQTELPVGPLTSEESDMGENDGRLSSDNSPLRSRRGGILKGGRLWKSLDTDKEINEQTDDRSTTTASDEDGSTTPRSVRFVERMRELCDGHPDPVPAQDKPAPAQDRTEPVRRADDTQKEHRLEAPGYMTSQVPKPNSAVQQLFNSGRPPPSAMEPQLITSETLRAWDAGVRPKVEDVAVRRVAERNALRCSLLRSEARKKHQPKQQETSLTERIRLLTCDVDEEADTPADKPCAPDKVFEKPCMPEKAFDKPFDKNSEKAFGSGSSSSSSSTLSTAVPTRHHPPDLGDVHQEPQKPRPEARRQFLSTLAPLTACVGAAAHHEGFYYGAVDRGGAAGAATAVEVQEHSDAPAPDIVAGTPGAGEGDDGLAAFARATAPRTERLRQRYGQESQPVSSDDEHDDYGFHRRPAVRGIATKQQLGASEDILQQMQSELQPSPGANPSPVPVHACQRTAINSHYSWPYYSENLNNSRPQSRASATSARSNSEYVSGRQVSASAAPPQPQPQQPPPSEPCYVHAHPLIYMQYQQRQETAYRNSCSLYANVGCSDSSQELYSSQTSSEQTSPVRGGRCRRPESPPPIRSHHQLLYVPYNATHYLHQHEYQHQVVWPSNVSPDYSRMHSYYQQQNCSGASTPQQQPQPQPQQQHIQQQQQHQQQHILQQQQAQAQQQAQRAQYTSALQLQKIFPAPTRYRSVPAPQPGGGIQMISYSEKVAAPLYQPAPGSPSRSARGGPDGGAQAGSPVGPPNPVYYAMNV